MRQLIAHTSEAHVFGFLCDACIPVYGSAIFRRKKNKSNLENLSGQLDNGASIPVKMAAPAGVMRFSDDEEDHEDFTTAYVLCCGKGHCYAVF